MSINGKIALITGGAFGIGRELAIAMGQAGAKIVINDLSKEKLEIAKSVFSEYGIDIYTIPFDVNDEPAVAEGIQKVQQEVGDIQCRCC